MPLLREYIDPPQVEQMPFGLFSIFKPTQLNEGHWQAGVEYESLNCAQIARVVDDFCATPGTNEVQSVTVTGTPTGGTYRLVIFGQTTDPIAYNASNATLQGILDALDAIDPGDVVVTGTSTARVLTFGGKYAAEDVPQVAAANVALTGGTSPNVTTSTTTPGVRTPKVTDPFGTGVSSFNPFALYAIRSCSGPADYARAKTRATDAFVAAEQRGVEAALWARWSAAAAGVTVINGTAQPRAKALAQAEEWMGDNYKGSGVFHVRRTLATHLSIDLTQRAGSRIETKLATPIVVGSGYGTAGPNGTAPAADTEWIFVTGQGSLRRSNMIATGPQIVQAPLDNTFIALVERTYVLDHDCILGAIAVTTA